MCSIFEKLRSVLYASLSLCVSSESLLRFAHRQIATPIRYIHYKRKEGVIDS
jgi:hypothetical protein